MAYQKYWLIKISNIIFLFKIWQRGITKISRSITRNRVLECTILFMFKAFVFRQICDSASMEVFQFPLHRLFHCLRYQFQYSYMQTENNGRQRLRFEKKKIIFSCKMLPWQLQLENFFLLTASMDAEK